MSERPEDELPDTDRIRLALEASWEIDGAAEIIRDHLDDIAENKVARTLCTRIRTLAGVVMSALGDRIEEVEDMRAKVDNALPG